MFDRGNIFFALKGTQKKDILKSLASKASEVGVTDKPRKVYKDYLKREKEATTGFGNGIAIPHAKSKNISEPIIIFARSQNEIEWGAHDGKPVNNFISILVPAEDSKVHLNLLAKLSRRLVHEDFTDTLKNGNEQEVYQFISDVLREE